MLQNKDNRMDEKHTKLLQIELKKELALEIASPT